MDGFVTIRREGNNQCNAINHHSGKKIYHPLLICHGFQSQGAFLAAEKGMWGSFLFLGKSLILAEIINLNKYNNIYRIKP